MYNIMSTIRISSLIWKDNYGGTERSLFDLASALNRNRFDMRFYYLSGGPGYFAEKIKRMGFQTCFMKWRNGFDLSGRIRLINALKEFDPHIIHDHILAPLTRPMIKMCLMRPILNTEHGNAVIRQSQGNSAIFRNYIARFDFKFCNFIAANSLASANALQENDNIPQSKISIVHLGIDCDHFVPNHHHSDTNNIFRIGYLGRIVNNIKGADSIPLVAKRLIKILGKDSFDILIAGDGEDRYKLEQLCIDTGVDRYIHFLGWVSDVKAFLDRIDVLIVPSRVEAFGLMALEALAMNVPVVAFAIGGLNEVLGECPIGKLVRPGDIDGMAEAIAEVLTHKERYHTGGHLFVKERFSNRHMASKLEELYWTLLINSKQILS